MLQNQILVIMISLLLAVIIVKGEKLPSVTLLADKYWAMKNQTIKLNCSSNIRSFGLNAEFLLYGNTYNNVGLFNNRCFRTIDARACTPNICSCSVDGLSFMFMFDISKISKTDNNGLLFGCQMNFRVEEFTKGLFASETFMIPVIAYIVDSKPKTPVITSRMKELNGKEYLAKVLCFTNLTVYSKIVLELICQKETATLLERNETTMWTSLKILVDELQFQNELNCSCVATYVDIRYNTSVNYLLRTKGHVNGFQTTDVFQTQPICSCVYSNRSSNFILSQRKDIINDSNDQCDCTPDVTDRQQVEHFRTFQLTVIRNIVASVCAMVFTVALMTVFIVMIKVSKPQNTDNDATSNNERTYQTLSPSRTQNQQYTEVQLTFYEEVVVPQVESHHYDTPSSEADISLLVPQINHYDVCEDF